MRTLLEKKGPLDAVFSAAGDDCAAGMLKTAREMGVRVPQDIAIVGYDDADVARLSTVALTTIRQPIEEMASAAIQMAMFEHKSVLAKPRKIYFRPQLIVRQTA